MSITENSWFLRVFLAAWLGLKQAGANSVLGRALDRVGGPPCPEDCLLYRLSRT